MAKRRRRHDEKKIHKKDRQARAKDKTEIIEEEREEFTPTYRKRQARSAGQRDVLVVVVAVIVIVAVLGGYFFYTNYLQDGSNDKEEEGKINPPDIIDVNGENNNNNPDGTLYDVPEFTKEFEGNPVVVIEVKNYGPIVVELYAHKNVQITVQNFLDYVRMGYYDGLIFHRVIDDFMIQGGGYYSGMVKKDLPEGKEAIPLEIDPSLKHVDGSLAMARTSDPDSATNQFYICDGPQSFLDGEYAVFGQTVAGIEHVRAIASVETSDSDQPVNDVVIHKAYEYHGKP